MSRVGRVAPATLWRALFVSAALLGLKTHAATPAGAPPDLAQVGKPDAKEAARLIEQFRNSGIAGEYYLEFELRSLPRRGGDGPTFKGRWWGSRNERGAITRIEVSDAAGVAQRVLLQNGEQAKVWRWTNGQAAEVGIADLMSPLVTGLEVSAFDLQMPYLYWPEATVEKITRVLGRTSYAFVFPAPEAFKAKFSDISAARAYLDTQFNVPMQTEVIGKSGKVTKTLAVVALQRTGDQTLPKSLDYRNEVTRDKTRLLVTSAALNLTLPAAVFQPASLGQPAQPPPAEKIVRFDP